jgi:hypothetical protein
MYSFFIACQLLDHDHSATDFGELQLCFGGELFFT